MSLYAQAGSFSVAAGVAAAVFVALFEAADDFSSILWAEAAVTFICAFTAWLGFGLGKVWGREPSAAYCAMLGLLFVCVSTGMLPLMPSVLLHTAGIGVVFLWLLITAPVFAFVGSLLTKRMQTVANSQLNTDARQEPPRAG